MYSYFVHHLLKYGVKGIVERLCQSISWLSRGMISFDLILSVQFIQSRALKRLTITGCDGYGVLKMDYKLDNCRCGEISDRLCPLGEVIYCG